MSKPDSEPDLLAATIDGGVAQLQTIICPKTPRECGVDTIISQIHLGPPRSPLVNIKRV